MKYVADVLLDLGIPHHSGVGKTGVLAIIRSARHTEEEPCIALRADLDALPIQEENNVDYCSLNQGVMHACGHDAHTAILLGTAALLWKYREQLPVPVKLIFQPGEEKNPGGATLMIADNVLHNPEVKSMYALHMFPELNVGDVGFAEGLYMASCDEIHLSIIGKGGHAATPHNCIDPIMIGAHLLIGLQQFVNRSRDPKIPYVLSFGHFEAKGATNVIPNRADIKGTFRTMNEEWRAQTIEKMEAYVHDFMRIHGAEAELEISRGYPFLENDPQLTRRLKKTAIEYLGGQHVHDLPIRLTSEDFSFYGQHVPICFYRIGVRNDEKGIVYGLHHPRFDIDEQSLIKGVEMMSLIALTTCDE
jgi:amidohydrolase